MRTHRQYDGQKIELWYSEDEEIFYWQRWPDQSVSQSFKTRRGAERSADLSKLRFKA